MSGIRRRDFVILLGGGATAAWPLAGRAQQKRVVPVIGVLSSRSPAVDRPLIAIIRDGLREGGFVDGQNVALDYHWTEGEYDRLASLAADLVRQQVAVIVAIGGIRPATRFDYEIEDPVLKRTIKAGYNVVTLPVMG